MAFNLLKTSQVILLCLIVLQASISSAFPQRRQSSVRQPAVAVRSSGLRLTREDVAAVPVTAAAVDDEPAATEAPAVGEMFIPLGEIPLEGELPASFDENFSDAVATEAPAVADDEVAAEDAAPVEDAAAEVEDAPAPVEEAKVEDAPAEEEAAVEEVAPVEDVPVEEAAVEEAAAPVDDDAEALRIKPAAVEVAEAEAPAVEDEPEVIAAAEEPEVAPVADAAEEPAPEETPAEDAAPVQEEDAVAEVEPASVPAVPEAPVAPVVAAPVAPPAKAAQQKQKPQKQTLYNVLPPLYGILYPLKPTGSPAAVKPGYAAIPPAKTGAKPVPPTTARPLYPPPAAYRPVFPVTDEFHPPSPTYRPSKTVKPAAAAAAAPVTNYPKFGVPPTPRGLGFPAIQNTRDNLRFDVDWAEVGRRQRSAAAAAKSRA